MTGSSGHDPDGLGPDPIGELLRRELEEPEKLSERGMERGWRPAPARIAAVAALVLILVGSAGYLAGRVLPGSTARTPVRAVEMAAETLTEDPGENIAARVAMVEGDAFLLRGGERTALDEDGEIVPGDRLETVGDSALGVTWEGGPSLVLEGDGLLEVRAARDSGIRIGLTRGLLAAHVPRSQVGEAGRALRIQGSNAELVVRGTVFTVRAEDGRLMHTAVSEGEVEVLRSGQGRSFRVGRSASLDMTTWQVEAAYPPADAVERLARVSAGLEVPALDPDEEIEEIEDDGTQSLTLEQRILDALAAGDVDTAIAIAEKHGKGQKSAGFHLAAGDAFRRAGRWSDAADAYLEAARAGHGKKSERAYIRAAEILFRKLSEPERAAELIEAYLKRFPSGSHLDEALYLGGVINMKKGDFTRALSLFGRYLTDFPGGAHAVRAHLAMAKILVVRKSDCSAAAAHIEAVQAASPGTSLSTQAAKLSERCQGAGGEATP